MNPSATRALAPRKTRLRQSPAARFQSAKLPDSARMPPAFRVDEHRLSFVPRDIRPSSASVKSWWSGKVSAPRDWRRSRAMCEEFAGLPFRNATMPHPANIRALRLAQARSTTGSPLEAPPRHHPILAGQPPPAAARPSLISSGGPQRPAGKRAVAKPAPASIATIARSFSSDGF